MKNINKIFVIFGLVEIVSGIVINPTIATYWRHESIINYYSPMKSYSHFAIFIGFLTLFIGYKLNTKKEIIINLSILLMVLSMLFLSDRLLLAKYGTGLWKYDKVLHYKQRPNSIFTWGKEFNNKLIKINAEGFHDDEFSLLKGNDEFRIFALGNSITMGHGVTKEETFSSQLEKVMSSKSNIVNVFNLGVQGYGTEQESEVFLRKLTYNPDLVMLEFCLNDITEPITVNRKFGGTGFDYHMIYQAKNKIIGFLINETGFGRFIFRKKFNNEIKLGRENELKQIIKLSSNPYGNSKFIKGWKITFNSIKQIHSICVEKKIPFIVLIFPYTFQLWNKELQKPQSILKSFLKDEKIMYIDFIKIFETKLAKKNIKKYFLDEDHYTYLGHRIIAEEVKNYLLKNKLL